MLQNLNQYFTNQKQLTLDTASKKALYASIHHKIKSQNNTLDHMRTRLLRIASGVVAVMLVFSLVRYGYSSQMIFQKLATIIRPSTTATADYVGTVISWDGTYQIVLNNKTIDTTKTANRIPVGSELVVEKGSKLSFTTSNKAQADVVGPAKISFVKNKDSNQLILDVQYSETIEIKQDKVGIVATTESNQSSQPQELLVVKTDNKTIVSKGDGLHIALVHKGEGNVITNKEGAIAITTIDNNKTVELKSNQIALLDAEVTLFAANDIDTTGTKKDEQLVIALSPKKNNETESVVSQEKDLSISTKNTIQDSESVSIAMSRVDDGSLSTMIMDELASQETNTTSLSTKIMEDSEDMSLMAKDDNEAYQDIEITAKANTLLDSKKVLTPSMVELLDALYTTYYNPSNKDSDGAYQITTIQPLLQKLCIALQLSCTNLVTPDDYKNLLRTINTTITTKYIVSSDIRLIKQ